MIDYQPLLDTVNDLVVNTLGDGQISYELADAWLLPPPANPPPGLTKAQGQVLSWLQAHRNDFVATEGKFRIDRLAIAGAIAWEALENVRSRPVDGIGRAIGPGKVHYSTERTWGEGNPLAKQVEAAGYLPRVPMETRRNLLRTVSGSLAYIGACMAALADIAANHSFNIRCNPTILCNCYQGNDLKSWEERLTNRPPGTPLVAGNEMALWMQGPGHLGYLEAGVGRVAAGICTPAFVGPPT
jgi:hypothetical protein